MNNQKWLVRTEEEGIKKVNWDELLKNGERYEVINNPDEEMETEEDVQKEKADRGEYAEETWLFDALDNFLADEKYFTPAKENILIEEKGVWLSKCDLTEAFQENHIHYFFTRNGVCIYDDDSPRHTFCPLSGEDKKEHFPAFFYMVGDILDGKDLEFYDSIIFTNFERAIKYARENC